MTVTATASPSLALVKYWGKLADEVNLAATSSLAVTIASAKSTTTIAASADDSVTIDGNGQSMDRFLPVIEAIRSRASDPHPVRVESTNNFPTAAGLASSSSGLAALTIGLDRHFATSLAASELSAIARLGSGSAARAVFGGFTAWRAGAESAEPFAPPDHWPELRILMVVIRTEAKAVSSRTGMEQSRLTSPYYTTWTTTSDDLFRRACSALENRDLESLGTAMRQSYLRMFSTMFTSEPPLIYWQPESLAVIRLSDELRAHGVPVWETMDAGPQVKLITLAPELPRLLAALAERVPEARVIESSVGGDPVVEVAEGV